MLIEGANLAADLRVEILRDGAWTRDIEPGGLFVNGARAGVLLSVRTFGPRHNESPLSNLAAITPLIAPAVIS